MTQTQTQTHTDIQTQTQTQTNRHRHTDTDTQTHRQRHTDPDTDVSATAAAAVTDTDTDTEGPPTELADVAAFHKAAGFPPLARTWAAAARPFRGEEAGTQRVYIRCEKQTVAATSAVMGPLVAMAKQEFALASIFTVMGLDNAVL